MSILKKFVVIVGLFIFFILLIAKIPAMAATLEVGKPKDGQQNITRDEKNLYIFGSDVAISSKIKSGLTALAGDLKIHGNIDGDTTSISSKLVVESEIISGSVRAVAGEIVISGKVEHDVILTGVKVSFYKAQILGDVVVYANQISFEDTDIYGNITGKYSKLTGDVEETVRGGTNLERIDDIFIQFEVVTKINWSVSLLILVLILTYIKKLKTSEISVGHNIYVDGMLGLLSVLSAFLIMILTWLLGLFWILGFFICLTIGLFLFANSYLAIYLANLTNNYFKSDVSIYVYIVAFQLLFITNLALPFLSQIIFLLYWFGVLGTMGFIVKKTFTGFKISS